MQHRRINIKFARDIGLKALLVRLIVPEEELEERRVKRNANPKENEFVIPKYVLENWKADELIDSEGEIMDIHHNNFPEDINALLERLRKS